MKVLVTGGAGYIGAITASALERAGHTPVILDSLVSGPEAFVADRHFYRGDIADRGLLRRIVDEHPDIGGTIHLAARIVVAESLTRPYEYYRDNVARSLELFDELRRLGKPRAHLLLVRVGVRADRGLRGVRDLTHRSSVALRAQQTDDRADPGGPRRRRRAERPDPALLQPDRIRSGSALRHACPGAVARRSGSSCSPREVSVTRSRSRAPTTRRATAPGLRDYVHVWDLALAHVAALERFDAVLERAAAPTAILNLGTGRGVTVRELVAAVETVLGRPVPDPGGAPARRRRCRRLRQCRSGPRVARLVHAVQPVDGVASAMAWADRREKVLGYP